MTLTGEPAAATTCAVIGFLTNPGRSSDPDRGERYIDFGRFFPHLQQYTQKLNGTYVEYVIDDDDEDDDEVPELMPCDVDENPKRGGLIDGTSELSRRTIRLHGQGLRSEATDIKTRGTCDSGTTEKEWDENWSLEKRRIWRCRCGFGRRVEARCVLREETADWLDSPENVEEATKWGCRAGGIGGKHQRGALGGKGERGPEGGWRRHLRCYEGTQNQEVAMMDTVMCSKSAAKAEGPSAGCRPIFLAEFEQNGWGERETAYGTGHGRTESIANTAEGQAGKGGQQAAPAVLNAGMRIYNAFGRAKEAVKERRDGCRGGIPSPKTAMFLDDLAIQNTRRSSHKLRRTTAYHELNYRSQGRAARYVEGNIYIRQGGAGYSHARDTRPDDAAARYQLGTRRYLQISARNFWHISITSFALPIDCVEQESRQLPNKLSIWQRGTASGRGGCCPIDSPLIYEISTYAAEGNLKISSLSCDNDGLMTGLKHMDTCELHGVDFICPEYKYCMLTGFLAQTELRLSTPLHCRQPHARSACWHRNANYKPSDSQHLFFARFNLTCRAKHPVSRASVPPSSTWLSASQHLCSVFLVVTCFWVE
ncbi:hypothetical protein R3P38DRAFT_2775462 [Favolaschia claudopus]|uniref:Uncharacterized protein n=1 Tax=Favolaschia claudopus TaxID=2862362 RepID=A0AAW0BTX5_9AGAR